MKKKLFLMMIRTIGLFIILTLGLGFSSLQVTAASELIIMIK